MLLIPYLDLRRAWFRQGNLWIQKYPPLPPARNIGYETENIAVPEAVFMKAILDGFKFRWSCEEEQSIGNKLERKQLSLFEGGTR